MNFAKRRMIKQQQAAKEGRRFHAFYLGYRAFKTGRAVNPFPAGSEQADCWGKGLEYARTLAQDPLAGQPVVKLGPGGDHVRCWPEGES